MFVNQPVKNLAKRVAVAVVSMMVTAACSGSQPQQPEARKWTDTKVECLYSNWIGHLTTDNKDAKLFYMFTLKDESGKPPVRPHAMTVGKSAELSMSRELFANVRRQKYAQPKLLFYNKNGFKVDELTLAELSAKDTVPVPRWSVTGNTVKADPGHIIDMPISYEANDYAHRTNISSDAIKWKLDVDSLKAPLNEPIIMEEIPLNLLGGRVYAKMQTTWIDDRLYYKCGFLPTKDARAFAKLCAQFKNSSSKFNVLFADQNSFALVNDEVPFKELTAVVRNGTVVVESLEVQNSVPCTQALYENIRKWNLAYPASL